MEPNMEVEEEDPVELDRRAIFGEVPLEDQLFMICQLLMIFIQTFQELPEMFGLSDSPTLGERNVRDVFEEMEDEHDENLALTLVARNLSLRWLVLDALNIYVDPHSWWVKPRSTAWFYEFLMSYYRDDRWIENMKMTRNTFNELCELLGPSIQKMDTNYRRAIPVFARVGAAIYKLTSGDGYGKVSEKFAMGRTSVRRVVLEVCRALGESLGHLIALPVGGDLLEVMSGFYDQCGIPNIAGAVDVTHISIVAPNTGFYRDYHKFKKFTITLQVVCDTTWRFRDIYVGWPRFVSDTRVLKYSSLWDRACRRAILNEDPITLPWRVPVCPFLLGDLGYPLMSWLQVPIKRLQANVVLTREEKRFNRHHKKGRKHIEQTFGVFKKLFGEVGGKSGFSVVTLPFVVRACYILHNFMIEKQENDYDEILREWEIEMDAARANHEDFHDEGHENLAQVVDEGMHRNLLLEEVEGRASSQSLVAYLNGQRT